MNPDELRLKHLEWIQNIIARQAANSFLLKGWSTTLVAGMLVLAAKDSERSFLWLAWFPVVAFALLDAFYLHKEKQFIALYDWVQLGKMTPEQVTHHGLFCLEPNSLIDKRPRFQEALRSPAIWGFYVPLLAASLLVPLGSTYFSQPDPQPEFPIVERPKTPKPTGQIGTNSKLSTKTKS